MLRTGGASCVGGTCTCLPPTELCNGVCVNTGTDRANCGACNDPCQQGATCGGGQCSCVSSRPDCADAGVCNQLNKDPNNCGGCNIKCDSGMCAGGTCKP
jgi:hypothetical protein